jgi:integrase
MPRMAHPPLTTRPRALARPGLSSAARRDRPFGSFLRWWMRDVVPYRVRPTTAASYDSVVRRRLIPAFGQRPMASLEAQEIQSHLAAELRAGWATTTVRQTLRVLRIALESAVELGLVNENVARRVATPRVERPVIIPMAPAEVRRLLRATSGFPIEHAVVLGLSGLRAGEVRGLRWSDLDLRRRTLHVRRTAQWSGNGLEIVPPKTAASRRSIKLPGFAIASLRKVPRGQRRGFLYAGARGTPLHGTVLGRWLAEASTRARLPRVTMHLLRHTAAAMMLESAVHLRVVMNVLGHARLQTTLDLYGHLRPELHRDAARTMDAWVLRQR